jgi:hypothetical protein
VEVACAGTTLAAYAYDSRSRRTGLDYANGASIAYEYDTANRLLSLDNSTGSGHYIYDYTYDKVGNRMTMDSNGSSMHVYDYDKTYQVTGENGGLGFRCRCHRGLVGTAHPTAVAEFHVPLCLCGPRCPLWLTELGFPPPIGSRASFSRE